MGKKKDRCTPEQRIEVKEAARSLYNYLKTTEGKDKLTKADWIQGGYNKFFKMSFGTFDDYLKGNFQTTRNHKTERVVSPEQAREFVDLANQKRVELRSQMLVRLRGRRMRYLQWTEHGPVGVERPEMVWFDYPVTFETSGLGTLVAEVGVRGRDLDVDKTFQVLLSGTLLHVVLTKVRVDFKSITGIKDAIDTAEHEVGVRLFPWVEHWWEDINTNPRLRAELDFAAGFGGWKTWSGRVVFSRVLLVDESKFLSEWPKMAQNESGVDRGSRVRPSSSDAAGAWLHHGADDWLHSEWERARQRNGREKAFAIYAPQNLATGPEASLLMNWA
ncbi:MAG: hypothetical protein KF912_14390 [Phycisphaeraceae bacterium]|nr:hypothetical protein [Phycisphaeraceae bacterium]MBX3368493.1 hypothetical protein [Phycisphaeraceae bacterium]